MREWKKYLKKQINNIIPLENIIKETREVEILHNLIKNNGQNFEITDLEKLDTGNSATIIYENIKKLVDRK